MSAEPLHLRSPMGGTFWRITQRDKNGRVLSLSPVRDVAEVRDVEGNLVGYAIGTHPARRGTPPDDLIFRPDTLALPGTGRRPRPRTPTTGEVEVDAVLAALVEPDWKPGTSRA